MPELAAVELSAAPLLVLAAVAAIASCAASSDRGAAARDAWHDARLRTLAAEDGWLTLAGLDFLEEGASGYGSGPDAALRYQNATRALAGTFHRNGERVVFAAAPGATVTADGAPCAEIELVADDAGKPTVLRDGPIMITLVRRNGRLALRVRDNASPVRTGFAGIELMPYDPSLAVEARLVPAAPDERVAITNVTGFVEEQPVAARLRFELGGEPREFVATAGAGGRLFVVFGDATNGVSTYGGGRFLDIEAPVDGRARIDFNRATNPPCSFTPFATCPLPPSQNRLPVAVEAGERAPKVR